MPLIVEATKGTGGGESPPFRFATAIGLPVALISLALLPFVPGLAGNFVFDDFVNLVEQPAFQAPLTNVDQWREALLSSGASDLGRPLSVFTLLLNAQATGLDPFWFKLTNLLLHGCNGLLLFQLLRQLLALAPVAAAVRAAAWQPQRVALGIAVIWTALAIHVSALLLVVQRMELLAHTFVLLGLIAYVAGRKRQLNGRRGGALVVCALTVIPAIGILAKESAVLVPVYCLALEVFLFRFAALAASARRNLRLLYGLLAVLGCLLSLAVLPHYLEPGIWSNRGFTLSERLLTEPRVLWTYVRWILLPDLTSMSLYHDAYPVSRGWFDPPSTLAAMAVWSAVAAVLAWLARRPSLAGLGIAWFLGAHLLTATVLPLELVFEHRNYFASAGVLIALLPVVLRGRREASLRRWLPLAIAAMVLAQSAVTAARAHEWGNPLRLAIAEAARNPDSPRAVYELGRQQYQAAGKDPARPMFAAAMRAFATAAALPGASALPLQALLVASASSASPVDANWWPALRTRVRDGAMDRQTIAALQSLVRCQLDQRCRFPPEELVATLVVAVNRDPPNAEILTIYAHLAKLQLQDNALAEELLTRALEIDGKNPLRWHQWGQAMALAGRRTDALNAADQIDRLDRWGRYRSKSESLRQLVRDLDQLKSDAETSDTQRPQ